MIDADVITAKLAQLAEHTARVRARCPPAPEGFANRDTRDLVAFNLMLAVQTCLDIASHVIAGEGWPAAPTLRDAFLSLANENVLEPDTATALARAAGLRNVVAHGYAGVDLDLLYRSATDGLDDLEAFATQVARWMTSGEPA